MPDNRAYRTREEMNRQKRIQARKKKMRAKRRRQRQIRFVVNLVAVLVILTIAVAGFMKIVSNTMKDKAEEETTKEIVQETTINEELEEVKEHISQEANVNIIDFSEKDYKYDCKDTEVLNTLKKLAETDDIIKFIYENSRAYTEDCLASVAYNQEKRDFIVNYPVEVKKKQSKVTSVSGHYKKDEFPMLIQWDDVWGYYPYGEDVIGISGCGPTCLSMIAVALTGDESMTPTYMADMATEKGYYIEGAGTTWDYFRKGVYEVGLSSRTIDLDESLMKNALDSGKYIVLSLKPGTFTRVGHYIVVYGYEDGRFLIRDPNSIIRSYKTYSFDELKNQIKNIIVNMIHQDLMYGSGL